jgi:hypothetical protein
MDYNVPFVLLADCWRRPLSQRTLPLAGVYDVEACVLVFGTEILARCGKSKTEQSHNESEEERHCLAISSNVVKDENR